MSLNNHAMARALLDFIDASPSPWHAGANLAACLDRAGFQRLDERKQWERTDIEAAYVQRGTSSLIAFRAGQKPLLEAGSRIVAAHTDSPGLRIKPKGAHYAGACLRLGVEIYGSPLLATWTDRDLSLAGRVHVRSHSGEVMQHLVRFPDAMLRLPNLAIHMNRTANEDGLKLHRQHELPLILGLEQALPAQDVWRQMLAEQMDMVAPEDILSFEMQVYDVQPGCFWGLEQAFIADGQLDNLASCHAALQAMLRVKQQQPEAMSVAAFFDHEEIGSETPQGAAASFLGDVLERISEVCGYQGQDHKRMLAHSHLVSVDMAHAWHPNFPDAYEPQHHVHVNAGPVIKSHACGHYLTDSVSEARFIEMMDRHAIPWQRYIHRSNLACGATVGPMLGARLGIQGLDIGSAMWAMHSARESAGARDQDWLVQALTHFLGE